MKEGNQSFISSDVLHLEQISNIRTLTEVRLAANNYISSSSPYLKHSVCGRCGILAFLHFLTAEKEGFWEALLSNFCVELSQPC